MIYFIIFINKSGIRIKNSIFLLLLVNIRDYIKDIY